MVEVSFESSTITRGGMCGLGEEVEEEFLFWEGLDPAFDLSLPPQADKRNVTVKKRSVFIEAEYDRRKSEAIGPHSYF